MYEYGREKLDVNHFRELFEAYAMALVNNVLFIHLETNTCMMNDVISLDFNFSIIIFQTKIFN